MSGKCQTIGDFAVSQPSQILLICRINRQSTQKSGMRWKNRNASDFPVFSPTIPDDQGCLRFCDFINWQNLGNGEIPHHLGFSRNVKKGLNAILKPRKILPLIQ